MLSKVQHKPHHCSLSTFMKHEVKEKFAHPLSGMLTPPSPELAKRFRVEGDSMKVEGNKVWIFPHTLSLFTGKLYLMKLFW